MTLEGSDAWTNIVTNDATSNVEVNVAVVITVSANSGSTVSFPIIPTKLGNIPITVKAQSTKSRDAVRRHLLVEVCYTLLLHIMSGYQYDKALTKNDTREVI